jgi:bifunctional DNA-binding transcriptional regulator/antitoxin component of YhaV-PrlF toxin-antitoxin module
MVMAQVRECWQVTLPREVRQSLDLHEGSDLLFIPTGRGEWIIKALPPRLPLSELLARFTDEGPAPDLDQLREEIESELAREYSRPEKGE